MDDKLTPELKSAIDKMTQFEMCSVWRFAKSGNVFISGETGQYFKKRLFDHYGGFTTEISKELGFNR